MAVVLMSLRGVIFDSCGDWACLESQLRRVIATLTVSLAASKVAFLGSTASAAVVAATIGIRTFTRTGVDLLAARYNLTTPERDTAIAEIGQLNREYQA
jgi:hypothetical protein